MGTNIELFSQNRIVKKVKILKDKGLYPFFRSIEETAGPNVNVNGKELIMIGSNNYLGLTHHPRVKEAAIKAIEKYGTGCTGSRFLNGNFAIHEELEERLAKFIGHESSLIFSTGMQSNLGGISALSGPRDCLINDMENHASLIDANRLGFGTTFKYKHNNMEDLEAVLKREEGKHRMMIIVMDGVFSMTGDIADLPNIVRLAKQYGAQIYVDDAHGFGVLGRGGRGTAEHFGLIDDVDFVMGTFSKSFSSIGGFVSGSKDAMEYLRFNARSFMFSASMPPSAVASVLACLDIIEEDKEDTIFNNLKDNVDFMNKGLKELGYYTYDSCTPIIPIFVGDDLLAFKISVALHEYGVFATPVVAPAVPKGEALIRTSYMATHTKEQLQKVLDIFARIRDDFKLPMNQ